MRSGWIHELKLHHFTVAKETRFVVIAKVGILHLLFTGFTYFTITDRLNTPREHQLGSYCHG